VCSSAGAYSERRAKWPQAQQMQNPTGGQTKAKAEFKVRWLLAHEPVRVFERAAKQFKNEVESASQGKIEVEVLTVSEYKAKYGIEKKFVADNIINDVALLKAGGIEMTQTYTTELGHFESKNVGS
jgi:hypothetical protein